MENPIVRTFDDFESAERAREELVASGFDRDCVELSPTGDEAGAVQGNFTVGDDPKVAGGTDYNDTYRPKPGPHGQRVIVTVRAPSPSEADRAAAILEGNGAYLRDPGAMPAGQRQGPA